MGGIQDQIRLIRALREYLSAEFCASLADVRDQQRKADRLHDELCQIAFACGYSPGREHRHMTVVQWAQHRAQKLNQIFPAHIKEAGS